MDMDRRDFLSAASAVGLASLAGCAGTASASAPAPRLDEDLLSSGGWKQIDQNEETVFEKSYSGFTIEAHAHTLVYEDAELRGDMKEKTMGAVASPLSILFATRIDFSPSLNNLPGGIGQDKIASAVRDNAQEDFEKRLKENGLTDIKETGESTLTVDTGEEADVVELSAVYSVDDVDFQLPEGDESVTIEGASLTVDAFLAAWNHGEYTLLAGGAYPAENFARSVSKDVTEAINISVDVDLGLTPEKYASETTEIVKSVK